MPALNTLLIPLQTLLKLTGQYIPGPHQTQPLDHIHMSDLLNARM